MAARIPQNTTDLGDVSPTAPTTTGQVPTWNNSTLRYEPGTPSGGGAPTSTPYVTTAADATLSAEVIIPGLSGSADISGAGGGGITEEYNTSTTGLTWSADDPETVDSNTTVKSHLYIAQTTNVERLGLRSWSPGSGAFDARCHVSFGQSAESDGGVGLIITNSGSTSRLMLQLGWDTTNHRTFLGSYTYASGSYTQRGNSLTGVARYLRISRDGSNNVTWWISIDGLTWQAITTFSFTLTVANIGYRLGGAASATIYVVSDWLRTNV